jgi:hypothetical protein
MALQGKSFAICRSRALSDIKGYTGALCETSGPGQPIRD